MNSKISEYDPETFEENWDNLERMAIKLNMTKLTETNAALNFLLRGPQLGLNAQRASRTPPTQRVVRSVEEEVATIQPNTLDNANLYLQDECSNRPENVQIMPEINIPEIDFPFLRESTRATDDSVVRGVSNFPNIGVSPIVGIETNVTESIALMRSAAMTLDTPTSPTVAPAEIVPKVVTSLTETVFESQVNTRSAPRSASVLASKSKSTRPEGPIFIWNRLPLTKLSDPEEIVKTMRTKQKLDVVKKEKHRSDQITKLMEIEKYLDFSEHESIVASRELESDQQVTSSIIRGTVATFGPELPTGVDYFIAHDSNGPVVSVPYDAPEQNIEQITEQNIGQNTEQITGQNIEQITEQNIGQNIEPNIEQNPEKNLEDLTWGPSDTFFPQEPIVETLDAEIMKHFLNSDVITCDDLMKSFTPDKRARVFVCVISLGSSGMIKIEKSDVGQLKLIAK